MTSKTSSKDLFKPYEKILESAASFPSIGKYFVTEKIHGANFSLLTTSKKVYPCSRREVLSSKSQKTFFGVLEILKELKRKAKNLFKLLADTPDILAISIFGEFCGGNRYPGMNPALSPITPVQIGIVYSPFYHFIVFDIAVITTGGRTYLPFTDTLRYCEEVGLPTVPVIAQGTLRECLKHQPGQVSLVPAMLGHPTDALVDNVAEGIVIRPDVPVFTRAGHRVILKRKVDCFSELEAHSLPRLAPEAAVAEAELMRRAVPARLSAVQSKLGLRCDREELARELQADCLEHFMGTAPRDAVAWWCTVGGCGCAEEGARVLSRLHERCALLVAEHGR